MSESEHLKLSEERAALDASVAACQEQKGVSGCRTCSYFEFCEQGKRLLFLKKYHNQSEVSKPEVLVADRLPDWMFSSSKPNSTKE